MRLVLIITLILVLADGLDYQFSFTGSCEGGHNIQGTAKLAVHGPPIDCMTKELSIQTSDFCGEDIVRATVTLHGKSATLFDKQSREYNCWLGNYSDSVKTLRLLDWCPNEITYVSKNK